MALQEITDQHGDVPFALTQRRQVEWQHIQSIEKILAEFTFMHRQPEVAVGGGNHAHVDMDRVVATDWLDIVDLAARAII